MNTSGNKMGVNLCFLRLALALIFPTATSCAVNPSVPQQVIDAWAGIPVNILDTHTFFKSAPMFRTKTENGTEIRNYAYGYDFQACASKAGARHIGDFISEDTLIACSSSRIVCNNMFYIKEERVLEYAPTGRCDSDQKIHPQAPLVGDQISNK